jgi:hypothetical protein
VCPQSNYHPPVCNCKGKSRSAPLTGGPGRIRARKPPPARAEYSVAVTFADRFPMMLARTRGND